MWTPGGAFLLLWDQGNDVKPYSRQNWTALGNTDNIQVLAPLSQGLMQSCVLSFVRVAGELRNLKVFWSDQREVDPYAGRVLYREIPRPQRLLSHSRCPTYQSSMVRDTLNSAAPKTG
jgi:hypothetical protein